MESFQTQIEDMIGTTAFDDTTFINAAIQDVGAEIIKVTPDVRLKEVSKEADITSDGLSVLDKRILEVHKSNRKAKPSESSQIAKVKDSGSIHYATTRDPVFYFSSSKVYVVAGGSETTGNAIYVPKIPTSNGSAAILYSSTAITNFPQEAIHILVTGAAARCLQQLLFLKNEKLKTYVQTDEDPEMAQAITLEINAIQSQMNLLETKYTKSLEAYIQ
tara:strand:+ start:18 stop:671 length:654 start_codon:yes stop_codon:yes gene_type:complete